MLTIFLVIICVLRDRRPFLANWGHAVPSSLTLPCRTPSTTTIIHQKIWEKRPIYTTWLPPQPYWCAASFSVSLLPLSSLWIILKNLLFFGHLRNIRDRIRWKWYFLKASRFSQNWWKTTLYTFVDVRIA